MFIFIKRTLVSWQHDDGNVQSSFGGGIPIFNDTENTFVFQTPNGTNFPKSEVNVLDCKIIDQTDNDAEYTFTTTTEVNDKLIELNYPYINQGIAGVTPNLSQVLGVGNRDIKPVNVDGYEFENEDKSKFLLITGTGTSTVGLTLDNSLFGNGDAIWGVSADPNEADIVIDNSNSHINPTAEASFTIPFLNEFLLRRLEDGSWSLVILQNPINITSGGGATDLGYTPSAINGIVTSSTGTDATIPLADGANAGLSENNFTDAEKTKLGNQSGTNTGDQDLSGLLVKSNNLSDLTNASTARTNLGLGSLATQSGTFSGTSSGTNTGDQDLSSLQVKSSWVDYSSTSTIVGWSTFTTKEVFIKEEDKGCWVKIKIEGPSNSGTTTCTLNFNADESKRSFTISRNAGTYGSGVVDTASGSNTLTFYNTVSGGAYTASGTKLVDVTLFIKKA